MHQNFNENCTNNNKEEYLVSQQHKSINIQKKALKKYLTSANKIYKIKQLKHFFYSI